MQPKGKPIPARLRGAAAQSDRQVLVLDKRPRPRPGDYRGTRGHPTGRVAADYACGVSRMKVQSLAVVHYHLDPNHSNPLTGQERPAEARREPRAAEGQAGRRP